MLRKAVKEEDFKRCVEAAEFLRTACGLRYHEICDLVKKETGLEVAEWDSFMYEDIDDG